DTSAHSVDSSGGSDVPKGSANAFLELFSLRRTRNAIYVLAVFAGFALAAWRLHSLFSDRQRLVEDAKATASTRAQSAVNYVERTLDVADLLAASVTDYIAREGGLATIHIPELQHYIAASARDTAMPDYIMVANAGGEPIAISEKADTPRINFSDRGWFRAHRAGTDIYIGGAVKSRLGRNIVYTYSKRVVSTSGAFEGVVDVAVQPQQISDPSEREPGMPVVQLWTPDGRLIVSNFMAFDSHGNLLKQVAPFRTLPPAISGFLNTSDHDLIVAYRKAVGRPLIATVTYKRAEILMPWDRDAEFSSALFVMVLLAGGLLARFATDLADNDQRARKSLEATAEALGAALMQRNLLLKEIHHRVKNNLQLTSSLIQMQARQFENDAVRDAFRRTQQRVIAIGMIHDVLYNDDANALVDVRGYLERLTTQIARAEEADRRGIKTTLDVGDIQLVPEQATPMGLISAEVLNNAYKHAFPEGRTGVVAVTVKEADGEIELSITDNGAGYTPPEQAKNSLGGRLIQTLTTQLHGTAEYTRTDGTAFRLRFRKSMVRPLLSTTKPQA
ncbi:MAG TPA: histidine kinase dimerization/phosphoacceptor domain -containing protein, partial [Rhizomicrobium sp.]|nr:histidine kinase dimerization/phosphoacceptor domain -containing protein [Rhizomicrobium sp.]